jgi:uncharacterized membrane protein YkvA (DUF1232 family)
MSLLGQLKPFWETICYMWRDARVPVVAKIFVLLAPLYWINPCDLIPDLQPCGYHDDVIIFCLLMLMALRLIPDVVFRDASKTALVGKKLAVFGMLYVTLTGAASSHSTTPFVKRSTDALRQQISIDCSESSDKKQQSTQVRAQGRFDHGKSLTRNHFSDRQYFARLSYQRHSQSATTIAHRLVTSSHRLPVFLTTRGGQCQLYASEYCPTAIRAATPMCPFEMPPQFAGGIFAGLLFNYFPFGEGSC